MMSSNTCACSAVLSEGSSGESLDLEQLRKKRERVLKLLQADLKTVQRELEVVQGILDWVQVRAKEATAVAELRDVAQRLEKADNGVFRIGNLLSRCSESLYQIAELLFEAGEEVA